VLRGKWGFEEYVGPEFQMEMPAQQSWRTGGTDDDTLIVGRDGVVHVRAESVSCLRDVEVEGPEGRRITAQWQLVAPGEVVVKFPLQQMQPGGLTLRMAQYGDEVSQAVPLQTYTAAAHLDDFVLYAGDAQGLLKGQRLDQVTGLSVGGMEFSPGPFSRGKGNDELLMLARNGTPQAAQLNAGDPLSVRVSLNDGRTLALRSNVLPARPGAALIDKSVRLPPAADGAQILMANNDELPLGGALTFSLRSSSTKGFGANQRVEIASRDGLFTTTLTLAKNQLRRAGAGVVVASLDPVKEFGPDAFGPLQFRVVADDVAGDWSPLITLIRLPELDALTCAAITDSTCSLSGANLYLLAAVGRGPQFENPVQVPEGFAGHALLVPHPGDDGLYVKLRDNPAAIHAVTLKTIVSEAAQQP
jgi:hypothetical protein